MEMIKVGDKYKIKNPDSGKWVNVDGNAYNNLVRTGKITPEINTIIHQSPESLLTHSPRLSLPQSSGLSLPQSSGLSFPQLHGLSFPRSHGLSLPRSSELLLPQSGHQSVQLLSRKDKVLNPESGKWINIGGTVYNRLIREGKMSELPFGMNDERKPFTLESIDRLGGSNDLVFLIFR